MQPIRLVDFGSTFTKVTAVDADTGEILDTARAFTTAGTDIVEGFHTAVSVLDYHLGKPQYGATYACSSAAGGLRMVAVGLVPDFTVEAARRAALSAGAKVIKVFSYDLSQSDAEEMESLRPDIVLLTGGTDGGNFETILHNAYVIASVPGDFPVVVAGNRAVSQEAAAALEKGGKEVSIAENVLPNFDDANIRPAREMIRSVFLKRIIRAKGLSRVQEIIDGILMPTPSAVLSALQALSAGAESETGIGNLMAVDVGGATTDVYSMGEGAPTRPGVLQKGLIEPYAKRTVEGDIGVRVSARSLLDAVGADTLAVTAGMDKKDMLKCLDLVMEAPGILPQDNGQVRRLDQGMTKMAIRVAMQRHVGSYEFDYSDSGASFIQTGKDLTRIGLVIGTGGPVIGAEKPEELMDDAIRGGGSDLMLMPRHAAYAVDRRYVLAALGLLSERMPALAVRMMKCELGL